MKGMICIALAATAMMACSSLTSSSQEPKSQSALGDEDPLFAEESASRPQPNAPAQGPQCVDADGYQIECVSDKDCCPDFYCGKDPEGSYRKMTCLYGGG